MQPDVTITSTIRYTHFMSFLYVYKSERRWTYSLKQGKLFRAVK